VRRVVHPRWAAQACLPALCAAAVHMTAATASACVAAMAPCGVHASCTILAPCTIHIWAAASIVPYRLLPAQVPAMTR
jgi:hypothetical protein